MIMKTDHEVKTLNASATALRFEQLLVDILQLCQQDLEKGNDETFEKIVQDIQCVMGDKPAVEVAAELLSQYDLGEKRESSSSE
jgi:hypothetical protein